MNSHVFQRVFQRLILSVLIFGIAGSLISACDDLSQPTSDQKQNAQQEQVVRQSVDALGLPAITRFTEKRELKEIFEKRDEAGPTYTYTYDLQGRFHFLCNSMGYPLPYATQYTSPGKTEEHTGEYGGGNVVVPQADPNALFSPADADGTWVYCYWPGLKKALPAYVEPHVATFPQKLPNALPY